LHKFSRFAIRPQGRPEKRWLWEIPEIVRVTGNGLCFQNKPISTENFTMKVNIAIFLTLLLIGSTWVESVGSEEPSLSQIVFYVG
jgi:hypothetical protein